jgi:energy-coupling factor transporter transmembrane protein EcfT
MLLMKGVFSQIPWSYYLRIFSLLWLYWLFCLHLVIGSSFGKAHGVKLVWWFFIGSELISRMNQMFVC